MPRDQGELASDRHALQPRPQSSPEQIVDCVVLLQVQQCCQVQANSSWGRLFMVAIACWPEPRGRGCFWESFDVHDSHLAMTATGCSAMYLPSLKEHSACVRPMRTVIQLAISSEGDPPICCRDSIAEMMMRSALHTNTCSRLPYSPSCYRFMASGDFLEGPRKTMTAMLDLDGTHRSLYWFVSCVAVAPDRADDAPQERMQPPPFSSVSASPSGLRTAMSTVVKCCDPAFCWATLCYA